MRKLLNTLFVNTEDAYVTLENENVVVTIDGAVAGRFPLQILEGILIFSHRGASPYLMGECAKRGIQLSFFSPQGRFLAQAAGEVRGNVLLRKQQYRTSDDEHSSCLLARNFVLGKVYNGRWVLERTLRDARLRIDEERVKTASEYLKNCLTPIVMVEDLAVLRGFEGEAAERYFGAFDQMILNQKEAFNFTGRNRRPPMDRVNALLSFLYAMLTTDCANALSGVGLDPYVGFLHRDRPGRMSLALDLMEELRAPLADRMALGLINTRAIRPEHFTVQADGAVLLNLDGRKLVQKAWKEHKEETLTHPYLKEKLPWGLVPYVQALLLARTLRGDLDGYPPFFWK